MSSVLLCRKLRIKNQKIFFTIKRGEHTADYTVSHYIDSRSGSWYREPLLLHTLGGDMYITPAEYQTGRQAISEFLLNKGETHTAGDCTVTFKELVVDKTGMAAGKVTIGAHIDVRYGGAVYPLVPSVVITPESQKVEPVLLPNTAPPCFA